MGKIVWFVGPVSFPVQNWPLNRKDAKDVTVRLGEYDFDKQNANRQDFQVVKITMHEQYERKTFGNDIALLKLIKQVNFTSHVQPICLPASNTVLEGQSAYVTGG